MPPNAIRDELERLIINLDDRHSQTLARDVLTWAYRVGLAIGPGDAERAVTAGVFALRCSPSSSNERSRALAACFVLWFLRIDDVDPKQVAVSADAGDTAPAPAWWSDLAPFRLKSPDAAARLQSSLTAYYSARRSELATDPCRVSFQNAWELRRGTIFNDPYVDFWLLLEGVSYADSERTATARRIAAEIVFILNDLASVERDQATGDMNSILTYVRTAVVSREHGIAAARQWHNERVSQLRTLIDRPESPDEEHLLQLLRAVVSGNRRSHDDLVRIRYPSASIECTMGLAEI